MLDSEMRHNMYILLIAWASKMYNSRKILFCINIKGQRKIRTTKPALPEKRTKEQQNNCVMKQLIKEKTQQNTGQQNKRK